MHFDNTFKVNKQKDKTNHKLQLRNVDTRKRESKETQNLKTYIQ